MVLIWSDFWGTEEMLLNDASRYFEVKNLELHFVLSTSVYLIYLESYPATLGTDTFTP